MCAEAIVLDFRNTYEDFTCSWTVNCKLSCKLEYSAIMLLSC